MAECAYYLELISQSVDGQLPQAAHQSLMEHLERCPDCRVLYQQLLEIHNELSSWNEQDVPAGFTQGVMARIRGLDPHNNKTLPFWKGRQFKTLGAIAACAMLCLGLRHVTPPAHQNADYESLQAKHSMSEAVPQVVDAERSTPQHECTPSSEILIQTISTLTGSTPGTVLVVDEIPEELNGTRYCSGNTLTFLVVDTDQPQALIQQLSPTARRHLVSDGESLVLVLCI